MSVSNKMLELLGESYDGVRSERLSDPKVFAAELEKYATEEERTLKALAVFQKRIDAIEKQVKDALDSARDLKRGLNKLPGSNTSRELEDYIQFLNKEEGSPELTPVENQMAAILYGGSGPVSTGASAHWTVGEYLQRELETAESKISKLADNTRWETESLTSALAETKKMVKQLAALAK